MRKRNIQIKLWCDEKERDTIDKKIRESRKSKQEHLLFCALKKKITRFDGFEDLVKLSKQVKKIGNNINQIA